MYQYGAQRAVAEIQADIPTAWKVEQHFKCNVRVDRDVH